MIAGKPRRRRSLSFLFAAFLCFFLLIGTFVFVFRPYSYGAPPRIPQGWGIRFAPPFIGSPAEPNPLPSYESPKHPFLADTNSTTMHVDAFASGVHPVGGPLGQRPTVLSYAHARVGGQCACVTFDSRGNIVAVFGTFTEFSLMLLDPQTLRPMARFSLPARASTRTMNLRAIMSDTSGGAYFFLDDQDNAVLVDASQRLLVIRQVWQEDKVTLELKNEYDLRPLLEEHSDINDVITSVMPDWNGCYWFVSRKGLIGVLERMSGKTLVTRLPNEEIQNSFAVDQDGVYIVSDHALYGLKLEASDLPPVVVWREEYERSIDDKIGTITRGSGTTPTLLGESFVVIADNASPQSNILIYKRNLKPITHRLVAKIPVFEPNASATENSVIAIGNSIIVENNFGYDLFPTMMFGRTAAGGVTRIDFCESDGTAHVVWHNPIISQTTVPKLSLDTGLVYVYAKNPNVGWGVDAYYLSGIDFRTGETVFQVLAGTGVSYDNNWSPITLGPDRSAYIGVLRGLVKVSDTGDF